MPEPPPVTNATEPAGLVIGSIVTSASFSQGLVVAQE
jgi:hypothetical protein